MTARSDNPNPDRAASFEQALEQLELVVAALEEGRCGLSESLSHYERGVKLLRECYDLLAQAEQKIEILAGFDADGNPRTQPLLEGDRKLTEETPKQRVPRSPHSRRGAPTDHRVDDIPY